MAVTPEHYRAARIAIPRLPISAILGFALFGIGGSAFLAYTSFTFSEPKPVAASSNEAPVYSARAVPFDSHPEDPAHRAASIARALTASQIQARRAETIDEEETVSAAEPVLLAESDRELKGFTGFSNVAVPNNFLALTATSFGISGQNAPSGFVAPDAEILTTAPVPEASTWLCGGALFLLVAARGARAHWQRKRRHLR
jgi:hypothetical protein